MNISCDVILDLIPLVKDGVASEDTNNLVMEHIKDCESCKSELEIYGNKIEQVKINNERKIIFDIKRSIFITQIIILIAGAIVGAVLSNSMGLFYNFLIMPILGGIAFFTFKEKWYLVPIAVFVFNYLYMTISTIILDGFHWGILYAGLHFSFIYSVLVCIGVVITILLKIALGKRGEINEK